MIPVKTAAGVQVLKDRSAADLTPRQRTALILIDGKRSLAEVLAAGARPEDIERLLELELIAAAPTGMVGAQTQPQALSGSAQERYAAAYPIAARLTASLGLRGFRLNLAVEAATCYEDLVALSVRIREAVGSERFTPLALALGQR
jgi:hypothetical protein